MAETAAESTSDWAKHLETATKVAAILIGAAYVSGFLIVTIHHARLGIWQFDLLRPRILSAGTTFLVLILLATATALGAHRLLGVRGVGLEPKQHTNRALGTLITLICSTTTAYGFVIFLRAILAANESWKPWVPWQPLPLMILAGSVDFIARDRVDRWPGRLLLAALLAAGALAVTVWVYASRFSSLLALWFWVVMILVILLYTMGRYREALIRNQRLESMLVVAMIGMIYLYASQIYGVINPWFGGGAPMNAAFVLASPLPGEGTTTVEGRLLEETSHGYYVLMNVDPKRPMFIPRDRVAAIRFSAR